MKRSLRVSILCVLFLLVSGVAWAAYTGFAGNGRGGPLAIRPTCNDANRGRLWSLYGTPNDGTKSDLPQVCVYQSSGNTYGWHQLNYIPGG